MKDWKKQKLQNGTEVDIHAQDFSNECGPSCVAMVARLFGKGADIAPARREVGVQDGPTRHGHDWEVDGSYMTSLTQTLSGYNIRMAHTLKHKSNTDYKNFCEKRSTKSPAILRIDWDGQGGHFVVGLGQNGNGAQQFIEILDPYYGYQKVLLSDFPRYKAVDDKGVVIAEGNMDRNWTVETT